jgi:hypothetical protein
MGNCSPHFAGIHLKNVILCIWINIKTLFKEKYDLSTYFLISIILVIGGNVFVHYPFISRHISHEYGYEVCVVCHEVMMHMYFVTIF